MIELANIDRHTLFVAEENALEFCRNELNMEVDPSKLKLIFSLNILPLYSIENNKLILKNDLILVLDTLRFNSNADINAQLYDKLFEQDTIRIGAETIIELSYDKPSSSLTFYSAARNLIAEHTRLKGSLQRVRFSMPYFSGYRLKTLSKNIYEFAEAQLKREQYVDMDVISLYARSAYYMGSKRSLCGFIVEAIASVLPESGVVIDLMCGSGVASGAFCKIWETYSSDAQEFCKILAIIHGGGFDRESAETLISQIMPLAKNNFNDLKAILSSSIEEEDRFFSREISEDLVEDYRTFIQKIPQFQRDMSFSTWNPNAEVERRRINNFIYPYCLFTAYFSNIYFGLRQCLEIDSLRYAIEQLQNENEKKWALGALIATLSALGSTYAGHFAQPLISDLCDLSIKNISAIVDRRSRSITHEFTIRLLNLSEQSQKSKRRIEIVPGPWRLTLVEIEKLLKNRPIVVYLDAPYKREEYSRYYHVLETLILYNYPSCTGSGMTPKPGDRFRSEFFTKKKKIVIEALEDIITNILQRGWICAWSYSDSAVANIAEIIESVSKNNFCDIKSYCVPFMHKSQGGAKPRKVKEYLILFSPKK